MPLKSKLLCFCVLITGFCQGQSEVKPQISIHPHHFKIDQRKGLILINSVGINKEAIPGAFESIKLDAAVYYFVSPIDSLEPGIQYQVKKDLRTFNLYYTRLPIVSLSSKDSIRNEPKVYADFTFADTNQTWIENQIGIEYRGASTLEYRKKSYAIEFQNEAGEETDISFPGMRSDDDWNLIAIFNDPIRTNNRVSYDLWLQIHKLYYQQEEPEAISGVRTRYVEVFVNQSYYGLFLLTEKMDRKQLKIKKYNGQTRGELYKANQWSGSISYCRSQKFNNTSEFTAGYELEYPKAEETPIDWTNLEDWTRFAIDSDSATFYNEIGNRFVKSSLIDYFIFLNVLRAVDNTAKNIFVGKYTNNSPYFFIPWDMDATFGNDYRGWPDYTHNDILSNGLYERLIKDKRSDGFCFSLASRWNKLRTGPMALESIKNQVRKEFNFLQNNLVYEREGIAWDTTLNEDIVLGEKFLWFDAHYAFIDSVFTSGLQKPGIRFVNNCVLDEVNPPDTAVVLPPDTILVPPDTVVIVPPDTLQEDPVQDISVRIVYDDFNFNDLLIHNETVAQLPYLLFDYKGCLVQRGEVQAGKTTLSLTSLKPGIYHFKSDKYWYRFAVFR